MECKCIYINPLPEEDIISSFYPKNYYSYQDDELGFFDKLKINIVKKHTGRGDKLTKIEYLLVTIFEKKFGGLPLYRKKKGKFLDIGCGAGKNLSIVEDYGWIAHGIELDDHAVSKAVSRGLSVKKQTISQFINTDDEKYDFIRLWHVLEHLSDPNKCLSGLAQKLNPNGELEIAIPNANSWAFKIFGKYWYGLDIPRHIFSFNIQNIIMMIESNKLNVVSIKYSSCGGFLGSISNLLDLRKNLVNNKLLILLFSPLDFISDLCEAGDTLFIKVKK
jgi:2-polyprenyl-3-methyl-5-hydroxy-6-metoxy-1,4-benzoquinol methylase